MREQPHYTILLTKEFFERHHVNERMSMLQISKMLQTSDEYKDWKVCKITPSTLCKYCDRAGVPRRRSSEAKRNWDPNPLDWNISFENEELIEAIDGFILGDGSIAITAESKAARLTCGQEHQEFTLFQMSHFEAYKYNFIKAEHKKSKNKSKGFYWHGYTKFHPDLYKHYCRWYSNDGALKEPPADIRITPKSVMLWYLGDGSIVNTGLNSISLRLSTDSFSQDGVEFLASKLREKGVDCHRNNDNRIYIEAKGISAFFDFIGRESPVRCYDYKFKLPEWRFEAKRMSQVAEELRVNYDRLAHLVTNGTIQCHRASENGRPRFMPEHIEAIKKMIERGRL